MNITSFIDSLDKNPPLSRTGYYLLIINFVVNNDPIVKLLESASEIRNKVEKLLNDEKSQPKDLFGSLKATKTANYKKELMDEAEIQKNILLCDNVESHTILLASLKMIDNKLGLYRKLLNELLKTNFHKLTDFKSNGKIVGRTEELAEIQRILSRQERNNVLIIGPVGVGKTILAYNIRQSMTDKSFFQILPYSDINFDKLIGAINSVGKRIIFVMDEMFAFEPKTLKNLIDKVQIVGTANESTYRKFLAEYPHIISKFEVVRLDEPPNNDLKRIIEDYAEKSKLQTNINVDREILDELIVLTRQYISDPSFPAKGLMMIDDVFSFARASHLKKITDREVRVLISQKANVPIASLTDIEKKDLKNLSDRLKSHVKGQDFAVDSVSNTIQRSRLGLGNKNKPMGSFLFVGPSGVGKTELAKAIAKEMFGDSEAMIRIDMSEYSESHMVQRLIGSPPGYIGYEEGGQLTNPVRQKPFSLVLLDEIEKAHTRVFDIFLQVLDDGRLTDGQGKKTDFRNTIIVATSNAGIEDILGLMKEGKSNQEIVKELKEILEDYFRIEFLNRFDGIILFQSLSPESLVDIAKLHIEKLQQQLIQKGIRLKVKPETIETLANKSHNPRYGARGLLRMIQDTIESSIAAMIVNDQIKSGDVVEF